MLIPQSEINAWAAIFAEELATTLPPFFGVNQYDVSVETWDKFRANLYEQYKFVELIGGHSHFWTVRDHGEFKRVIWINYYPSGGKPPNTSEDVEVLTGGMASVAEGHQLINRYNWYTVAEVSDDENSLF